MYNFEKHNDGVKLTTQRYSIVVEPSDDIGHLRVTMTRPSIARFTVKSSVVIRKGNDFELKAAAFYFFKIIRKYNFSSRSVSGKNPTHTKSQIKMLKSNMSRELASTNFAAIFGSVWD